MRKQVLFVIVGVVHRRPSVVPIARYGARETTSNMWEYPIVAVR